MQGDVMDKKLNIECPDFEDISAYFDNELDVTSPEYIHIKTCELCQQELEACRVISLSIKGEFKKAVPDDFADNLITSIRAKEKVDATPKRFPLRTALRVAAMLVLSGIIVYSLITTQSSSTPSPIVRKDAVPLVFLNKKTPYSDSLNHRFQPSRRYAAGTENSIDMRNYLHVSTGGDDDEGLSGISDRSDSVAVIKPIVNQTWSVDNFSMVKGEIAKLADLPKIEKNGNGNLVLKCNPTKEELAELVRHFEGAGFRLLSPSQPQPEQVTFSGNKNDKVLYTATFVVPQ
jgi:hypothetical protein